MGDMEPLERKCYGCRRVEDFYDQPEAVLWHCYSDNCPCYCADTDPKKMLQIFRDVYLNVYNKSFVAAARAENKQSYSPCVVCGESRITYEGLIIPALDGGVHNPDNIIDLCPLHHHLFSHRRLSKAEWATIYAHMRENMSSAVDAHDYTESILQHEFQRWWDKNQS